MRRDLFVDTKCDSHNSHPFFWSFWLTDVDICAPDVAHNGIMWLPAHFALSCTCVRYVLSVIPEAGNPEDPKANTNYMILYDII